MVGILQQLHGCTALLSFFFYFCFFKLRMGLKLKGGYEGIEGKENDKNGGEGDEKGEKGG